MCLLGPLSLLQSFPTHLFTKLHQFLEPDQKELLENYLQDICKQNWQKQPGQQVSCLNIDIKTCLCFEVRMEIHAYLKASVAKQNLGMAASSSLIQAFYFIF